MLEELCERIWANGKFHGEYRDLQETQLRRRLIGSDPVDDGEEEKAVRLLRSAVAFASSCKPEYRQALDRSAEGKPIHQFCIEARDRKTCDRVDDEHVNIGEREACALHRLDGDLFQELQSVPLKGRRAILPAVRLLTPLIRFTRIACVDAGVGIEGFEPCQVRKNGLGALEGFALLDLVRRIGRGHRQDINIQATAWIAVNCRTG